ncbi:BnaC07g12910D [Brassica napus]|uniref:(rape) hypothetical protein n=1 Tax=Brassica napus TaxID=3708 RepID=A0A078GV10_BRANA|nr:unnamed protein product [Brassica napus]CDY28463.1 BnaC07g12910D [Brassica napus]
MMTTEDNVPEEYVSAEEYARVRDDYWRVVRESEGFDLEDVSIPPYMCGTPICVMRTYECNDCWCLICYFFHSIFFIHLAGDKLSAIFPNQIQRDDELCELVLPDLVSTRSRC